MKQKGINHILKNNQTKVFISVVICVILLISFFVWLQRSQRESSLLYQKLQGPCNVMVDYSYLYRDVDTVIALDYNIFIHRNEISLPVLLTSIENRCDTSDYITKWTKESAGRWEIISTSPDSILIETPKSILNGRYAVEFVIEKHFKERYFIIFSNDSTLLKCERIFNVFSPVQNEWGETVTVPVDINQLRERDSGKSGTE